MTEKTWTVSGTEDPALRADGVYYRVEQLEMVKDKYVLAFAEAREVLSKLVPAAEGELEKEKNPFAAASKEALAALQKDRQDPRWVQSGADPLLDQFKLERKEPIRRFVERLSRISNLKS